MTELANTYLSETVSVACREVERVQVGRVESKDGRREEETFVIRVSGNEEDTRCVVGEGTVSVGFEWLSEESSDENRKKWEKNKEHKTAKVYGCSKWLALIYIARLSPDGENETIDATQATVRRTLSMSVRRCVGLSKVHQKRVTMRTDDDAK
jgi:hypothetical protein